LHYTDDELAVPLLGCYARTATVIAEGYFASVCKYCSVFCFCRSYIVNQVIAVLEDESDFVSGNISIQPPESGMIRMKTVVWKIAVEVWIT